MEFFNPKPFFFALTAPSITFLFGGTNSGKTHLLGQILSQFHHLFDSKIQVVNFVLVYSFYQDYYNLYIDAVKTLFPKVKVTVFKGLTPENVVELQKAETWKVAGPHECSIFILDDVASSISRDFDAFWEGRCHHERIGRILHLWWIMWFLIFSLLHSGSTVHNQPKDCTEKCILLLCVAQRCQQ